MEQTVSMTDKAPPSEGELVSVAEGIYWLRMPLPMRLDHINLYMIDEGDSWSLIDTGMSTPDVKAAWELIFDRYCTDKPIKRVYVTHMHPDHVGMAGWIVKRFDAAFFMTQSEYFASTAYMAAGVSVDANLSFYKQCGMPENFMEFVATSPYQMSSIVHALPSTYSRLQDRQIVMIGGHQWQVITGEGHTFEHACLYSKSLRLLLAGDQLLPKITSNVSVHAAEPSAEPLTSWFESLDKLSHIDEATLVLPAHNKPFTGAHIRIEEIRAHHKKQLTALLSVLDKSQTIYDLLPVLFPQKLHNMEMPLAVGECLAHINYLVAKGEIKRTARNGVYYYEKTHVS